MYFIKFMTFYLLAERFVNIRIIFTKVDHAHQLFPAHLLSRLVVLRLVQDPHRTLGEVGDHLAATWSKS